MPCEILSISLAAVAIVGVLFEAFLVWKLAKEQARLIEQAFIHLASRSSAEAANAISAIEYNRGVVREMSSPPSPAPPVEPNTLEDKVTGRKYDIIGGDV